MAIDPDSLQAAGWKPFLADHFSGVVGPLWERPAGDIQELGFIAGPQHANGHMGTVHGGALMTFADVALGYRVVQALGAPTCATVQLQMHFVSAGRVGEFVTCTPEMVKRTSQLIFMRGLITADEKIVASADGVWKVLEPRRS